MTAIVIDTLRRLGWGGTENVRRAEYWLQTRLEENHGILPSYWWTTNAYGIWAQSRIGFAGPAAEEQARQYLRTSRSPLEIALAVQVVTNLDGGFPDLPAALERILAAQLADGSWMDYGSLRLTEPWPYVHIGEVEGRAFVDHYRVLPTAHCVAALEGAGRLM